MPAPETSKAPLDPSTPQSRAAASDNEVIRDFVHKCASLFVNPDKVAAIANQAAANYDHWRSHGELRVLLEAPETGEVEAQGIYHDLTWRPIDEEQTWFETVLPDGREALVTRAPNGEWGWAIRGAGCLDDSNGFDTYATREDAMRAVLYPEDAAEDRGEGFPRTPRTGMTYSRQTMLAHVSTRLMSRPSTKEMS